MAAKETGSNPCDPHNDSMNHCDMYPGSPNTSGASSDGPYYVVMFPSADAMAAAQQNHQRRKLTTANIFSAAADLTISSVQNHSIQNHSSVQNHSVQNHSSGQNHSVQNQSSVSHGPSSRANQRDERRRVTHNEVERRRRDKINNWITKLAKLIPDCCEDNSKQGQSKGGILAKACVHINDLTDQVDRLQVVAKQNEVLSGEIRRLQNEVAELKSENRGLKMALSIHGLQVPDDCVRKQRMEGGDDCVRKQRMEEGDDCVRKQRMEERSPESTFVSDPHPERRPSLQQVIVTSTIPPTTVSVINRSATSNNHSNIITPSTI